MEIKAGASHPTQFPLDVRPAIQFVFDFQLKLTGFSGRFDPDKSSSGPPPHSEIRVSEKGGVGHAGTAYLMAWAFSEGSAIFARMFSGLVGCLFQVRFREVSQNFGFNSLRVFGWRSRVAVWAVLNVPGFRTRHESRVRGDVGKRCKTQYVSSR